MNILLVQTAFIGDVVLATPVIQALKQIYRDSTISVLTTPISAPILVNHPDIAEVIIFDKHKSQKGLAGIVELANRLSAMNFDVVFSLHKSWRTAFVLWLAKIPKRYGFKEASGQIFYTKTVIRKDLSHEVMRNLAIMRNVGNEPNTFAGNLRVELPQEAYAEAEKLSPGKKAELRIVIAPGSVWATKRWTVDGFSKVATHFLSKNAEVILIGGEGDIDIANEISYRSNGCIRNYVGKLSLLGSAAIIDKADLLVANDSAPLHFASALKTPVVAIFCATSIKQGFGPWQVSSAVLGVDELRCRPCGRHGMQYCPTGTHNCQLLVTADKVIEAAERLLEEAKVTHA